MRKLLSLLLMFCLIISLVACGERAAHTDEEIIRIITKELDLDVSIQIIDTIDLNDVVLVCYMTGNEYQSHTYGYAEFEKQKEDCRFLRTYSMMERGLDLRSDSYNESYLFVINNENCKSLRIGKESEKEELITVDKIPFVYYMKDALNSDFEYTFLDKNGEEI